VLEGHTGVVRSVHFSSDGWFLASKALDGRVVVWRCDRGEPVSCIVDEGASTYWPPGIAFHPHEPILATLGENDTVIRIWEVDGSELVGSQYDASAGVYRAESKAYAAGLVHQIHYSTPNEREVEPMHPTDLSAARRLRILFLAANPRDTNALSLDHEVRAIDAAIREAEHRDRVDLLQQWAVRVSELQAFLLRHRPVIVHFSGHGSKAGQIILESSAGESQPVAAAALGSLFSLVKDDVRCVVLNACFTAKQAQAISQHIPYVIGMTRAIADQAAIAFATAFYRALSYQKDVPTAFELGRNQVDLEGLGEADVPKLLTSGIASGEPPLALI